VDPFVERAESHTSTLELEALADRCERDEVVVEVGQLSRAAKGGVAE